MLFATADPLVSFRGNWNSQLNLFNFLSHVTQKEFNLLVEGKFEGVTSSFHIPLNNSETKKGKQIGEVLVLTLNG